MTYLIPLTAFLIVAPVTGYDFPMRQWPDMTARLHIEVADQPDTAGFARVRLVVDVDGPQTLEVESLTLGDATAAWQAEHASSWRRADDRVKIVQTVNLRQVKPGLVPVPSIKVRCRSSAVSAWQDAEWTDILTDVRGLALTDVPPSETAPAGRWLGSVAALGVVGALAGFVIWRLRRHPPAPVRLHGGRTLTALQRLEAKLNPTAYEPRAFAIALSALVRRYVAERFALPALRQTTAEFVETLRATTPLTEDRREQLRTVLEACDLAKFAGVLPTLDESRELTAFTRAFIVETEPVSKALSR